MIVRLLNDPLIVLEHLHECANRLRELTGDALIITIEPAPAVEVVSTQHVALPEGTDAPPGERPDDRRHVREARELGERVARYLAEHPGARQAAIAADLELKTQRVADALRRLGSRVERGPDRRAEGQTAGRGSPTWTLVGDTPEPEPEPEPEPARATALPAGFRPPSSGGTPKPEPPTTATPPRLSARVQKSIEREQADARAIAALGDPPESRVFDLVRSRSLTIKEIAAELGEHQAVIAEEVHHLKPWLIQMHDGRVRAIERLREAA